MRRSFAASLVVLSFVLLAVAATWPLAARLQTHLPGAPSGDTGVYVWNLWVFRHEVDHYRAPLSTSRILSLTARVNLSLHNYTPVANVLAYPLLPRTGVVAAYNLLLILFVALNGWCTYLLARTLTPRRFDAWVAGAVFALSPVLIARTTAHFSLVAAFPLPLIALCVRRGLDTGRLRYAIVTGVLVAVAGFCDPYYAVYGALLVAALLGAHAIDWHWRRATVRMSWVRVIDVSIAVLAAIVVVLVVRGGRTFALMGLRIAMQTLYTPVLGLTALVLARVAITWRPTIAVLPSGARDIRFAAVAAVVGVCALSPTIFAVGERIREGHFDRPAIHWRSSPPGVDVASFVMPNPNHPVYGAPFADWLRRRRGDGFEEYTAALPLVGLALLAWAWRRGRERLPRFWVGAAVGSGILALGPFVHIAGANTHVPGPWALLRYVPVLELARSPSRFAVLLALAFALLVACALALLRDTSRRPRLAVAAVLAVLAFELLPAPRLLADAHVPPIYDIISADPDDRRTVLELPTGIRDGTSSIGNFSAEAQYFQTHHRKKLMGGYLSRVSKRRKREMLSMPLFGSLVNLSEGRTPSSEQITQAWQNRAAFVRRTRLGYVVINSAKAPPALKAFAIRIFDLEFLAAADGRELYRPRTLQLAAAIP